MNKRLFIILLSAIAVITVAAIIFGIVTLVGAKKYANEKTITLDDSTESRTEVILNELSPGDSRGYTFNLKSHSHAAYDVTLSFEKLNAESLAPFVDVTVSLNGNKLECAGLDEYLNGKKLCFEASFLNTSEVKVEILYTMDLNIGNEAQNTCADFNVVLFSQQ